MTVLKLSGNIIRGENMTRNDDNWTDEDQAPMYTVVKQSCNAAGK